MRNELGFDPTKKYAPVHVDAFDDKSLFNNESFDVIVDLDLLKYTDYFLINEFIKSDIDSPLFDFSLLENLDDEAFFALIYFRADKNPIRCFLKPEIKISEEELDSIWNEFKLNHKDRIFNYIKTSVYGSLIGLAVNSYIGKIFIWDDENDKDAQRVTEGEFRENLFFRQDKFHFIFTNHKNIHLLMKENKEMLSKIRIFIIDGLKYIKAMVEDEPTLDFYAGKSFVIPARTWNIYEDNVIGVGNINRYKYDLDFLAIKKGLDLKSVKLFNIPKEEIALG